MSKRKDTTMTRRSFTGAVAGGIAAAAVAGAPGAQAQRTEDPSAGADRPNVLFIMCDQLRADAIAALGNPLVHTPNMDRLVARGVSFVNGYSTCPVCVPARYTVRTGCEPPTTGIYQNGGPDIAEGQPEGMEARCGAYLPRTMGRLGYRTWGVGKYHTLPTFEDIGYEDQLYSEELYGPGQREKDDYAAFIAREHPAYDFLEGLMGERTEMYYMPQMSAMPAAVTVEGWAADRAVEFIRNPDGRPWFGLVSFVGPHPPCAPPIPFNRMYDPDRIPNPVKGDPAIDLMDEHVRWMNYAIWAEDINDSQARVLKARYYGEVSYIDHCLGRILDAVEARADGENTVICFFADHGDHLGDHHAWQKESYFDASCRVPFLVSWPARFPGNQRRADLACLTDLFGIATTAAGAPDLREGADVLGLIEGRAAPREHVIGYYGTPGSSLFKVMARAGDWKYIYMANGGQEQLFNVAEDPHELRQRVKDKPDIARRLRDVARANLNRMNADRALDGGDLLSLPPTERPLTRIYQFDRSRGVSGFPEQPGDALKDYDFSKWT